MAGGVRQQLKDILIDGSKAERRVASYMLANTAALLLETAASLAAKIGVSEPTIGRFCRTLGYDSFKDLKTHLGSDVSDRPWLMQDRLREFQQRSANGKDQLAKALKLEMAGLVAVYELAQSDEWRRVAKRLASAGRVFVTGFQTERGMAHMFAHQLQYLRDGVQLLDADGGHFVEMLATNPHDCTCVIFEARRYSRLAALLAQEARATGIPVTLVTDGFCDWGHGLVSEMLVVPTEFNLFWDSTAQMASLINLMMNSVSIEIGPAVEARMNRVSQLYSQFTGHVGDSSGPEKPATRKS